MQIGISPEPFAGESRLTTHWNRDMHVSIEVSNNYTSQTTGSA